MEMIMTERLLLRPFKISDAKAYFELTRDDSIMEYVPYVCPESLDKSIKEIEECCLKADCIHDFYFAIEHKISHKLIGALIITQNLKHEFDMNYIIGKKFRKKGYMIEALEGFIKYMPKSSELLFIIKSKNE